MDGKAIHVTLLSLKPGFEDVFLPELALVVEAVCEEGHSSRAARREKVNKPPSRSRSRTRSRHGHPDLPRSPTSDGARAGMPEDSYQLMKRGLRQRFLRSIERRFLMRFPQSQTQSRLFHSLSFTHLSELFPRLR
jgi:hypothetical protein